MIKEARIRKGLTQEKLGKKLGYKCGQLISNIERGLSDIPLKKIKRYGKLLGLDPRELAEHLVERYRKRVERSL